MEHPSLELLKRKRQQKPPTFSVEPATLKTQLEEINKAIIHGTARAYTEVLRRAAAEFEKLEKTGTLTEIKQTMQETAGQFEQINTLLTQIVDGLAVKRENISLEREALEKLNAYLDNM